MEEENIFNICDIPYGNMKGLSCTDCIFLDDYDGCCNAKHTKSEWVHILHERSAKINRMLEGLYNYQ